MEPQGVTPVYWQITNKKPFSQEGGWEILKQNCFKLCTLVQAATIMPCDSYMYCILKYMYIEFDQSLTDWYSCTRNSIDATWRLCQP